MTAWAAIENIAILGAVVYLVSTGHSAWWALLLLGMNSSKRANA